jgi:hypothetical protein
VGVLGGAAILGAVASYINNIGACIAVGAFAGVISGFWLRVIYPRLNVNTSIDQLGLIGPIVLNAFFGAAFVGPIVFGAYKSEGILPNELNTLVTTQRSSTFYLSIFGITIALAILTGLIAGALIFCLRDPEDDHQFVKLVSNDYGLYSELRERPVIVDQHLAQSGQSAEHLRNDRAAGF